MSQNKTRGLLDSDDKAFNPAKADIIRTAQQELQYLLDRGYAIKGAATFVGNHHQLTVRQLLALARCTATRQSIALRAEKRLSPPELQGQTIYIDGFNLIITLEVALSDGMLFLGQDGCIRDLAELRGTYRLIPQTDKAIKLVRNALITLGVERAVFYLDQPVSNSGRLKERIYETDWPVHVDVDIVRNPDTLLRHLPRVVSGDSMILDECQSWFNMTEYILAESGLAHKLTRLLRLDGHDGIQEGSICSI